jgi:isocitrate dehydrogenase
VQCGKPRESFAASRPWSEQALAQQRWMSAAKGKMIAPKMVYISGEEMTTYCMNLIMDKWIKPHVDTSAWEFYDLSCKSRDATNDKVLKDAVEAGARIGAIFKEPTITPSAEQTKSMGLKKQARHIYMYMYIYIYIYIYIIYI